MKQTSRQIAEQATFQSFANCYLREVRAGRLVDHRPGTGVAVAALEWVSARQNWVMRAEITYRSLCGPHGFGRIWLRGLSELVWRRIEPFTAVQTLVHEAYRQSEASPSDEMRGHELELLSRVLESYQSTAVYLDSPADHDDDSFIAADQSLVFGHWLHPTPKSRQGMTGWHQPTYAPELRGRFPLHFFAVKHEFVTHNSSTEHSAHDIVRQLLGAVPAGFSLGDDEALLPMHPLQAEALLLDPKVKALQASGLLRHLGPAGPLFTATSSVRTVYSAEQDFMLKFSLPVRITNSVRLNRRHELEAGVAMAKLFERTGFSSRHPSFRVIHDPAYITVDMPGHTESGFEVIFRQNPFVTGREQGTMTIAALTADPVPGERSRLEVLLRDLSDGTGSDVAEVCRRWFGRYLDVALVPLVALYDEHGVALEAHQQNSLLDVVGGYPRAYYYRDNQGFYLSKDYRESLSRLVPETTGIASLFHDAGEIDESFAYYLVVNQIFSIVSRMGRDGLIAEETLLAMLGERLQGFARTMTGAGRDFAIGLLTRPTIAAKANLLTRILDIDELEVASGRAAYTRLENPLFRRNAGIVEGGAHALAS